MEASVGVIRRLPLVAVVLVGIERKVAVGILAQYQSRSESTDEQELFNGGQRAVVDPVGLWQRVVVFLFGSFGSWHVIGVQEVEQGVGE